MMNQMGGLGFQQPRLGKGVKGLLYAIGICFILQLSFMQFGGIPIHEIFGFSPASFLSGRIWQIFTYPFLHGSLMHILFNALFIYMLGAEFERRWGTKKFLKYYFVCAIGGAVLQTFVWALALIFNLGFADSLGHIPVIGASGAIYGLFMAFGLLYGNTYVLVFFLIPMKAKHFVMLLTTIAIVSAVFYSDSGSGGGVAHLVHLGGLFTGFLYLRWKGSNLDGRGGGFGGRRKMSKEEVRRRLSIVVNNDRDEKGDKGQPIIWN